MDPSKEQEPKRGRGRPKKVKPSMSTQTETIPEPLAPMASTMSTKVDMSTMTEKPKKKRGPKVKKLTSEEIKERIGKSEVSTQTDMPGGNKLVEAFREALDKHDEELSKARAEKREDKSRSKRLLKEEFEGHPDLPAPVHERDEYRHFIMSMSLFPNLYNREMIMTHLGSS